MREYAIFFAIVTAFSGFGRLVSKSWITGLLVLLGPVGLVIHFRIEYVRADARRR